MLGTHSKQSLLAVSVGLALAACGGGGGGGGSVTTASSVLSGVAVDGYLQGATVFLDRDGDGILDAGEPATVTDVRGAYTMDLAGDTVSKVAGLPIVVQGGIDADTGYGFAGRMIAPVDASLASQVVTPLTTLVHEQLEQNLASSLDEARSHVAATLGLSGAAALTVDPVATLARDPEIYQKQVALQRAIESLAAAEKSASETDHDAQERIAKALARTIREKRRNNETVVDIGALVTATTGLTQATAKATVATLARKTEAAVEVATRSGSLTGIADVLRPIDQLKTKVEQEVWRGDTKTLSQLAQEVEDEHGRRGLKSYVDDDDEDRYVSGTRSYVPSTTRTTVAQPANTAGRLLASNCYQCHGTLGVGGFDRIRGDAGEMREFLGKAAGSDIMAAHAKGYTAAQIDAIVAYLNQ